jgi:competence ComEA-like helix-hairpin-helix protein
MNTPRVKINIDNAESIATLYGIGHRLAERIVNYRNSNDYFRCPDDLTKVDGIGMDLAITLSPHIDWEIPALPEKEIKPDLIYAIIAASATLPFLWGTYQSIQGFLEIIGYQSNVSFTWVWLWIDLSILTSQVSGCVVFSTATLMMLVNSSTKAHKLARFSAYFIALTIFGGISSGLAHIVYYQFYSPSGWNTLLNDAPRITAAISFILVTLAISPSLLALWYPKAAHQVKFARVFDLIAIIVVPSIAVTSWISRNNFPIWVMFIMGFWGFLMLHFGITNIRTGKSIYWILVNSVDYVELVYRRAEISVWLKWINARLPDPDEQKALKRALDEAYPPSRMQTIASMIIIGAGSWLVITALESIVDFFIQNWLTHIIEFLK